MMLSHGLKVIFRQVTVCGNKVFKFHSNPEISLFSIFLVTHPVTSPWREGQHETFVSYHNTMWHHSPEEHCHGNLRSCSDLCTSEYHI